MLLPIAPAGNGSWHFVGYHGLASHGGAVGAMVGVLIYKLVFRQEVGKILDWAAIATPLLGGFVRIGNFTNGEIVGRPTTLPWGVVFDSVDSLPRHPAQLYEAAYYFFLFFIVALIYKRMNYRHCRPTFYFGLIVAAVALFRIAIECVKEPQVSVEIEMTLNIGQWLSIPLAVVGVAVIIAAVLPRKKSKSGTR